jgi:hypothetical protein
MRLCTHKVSIWHPYAKIRSSTQNMKIRHDSCTILEFTVSALQLISVTGSFSQVFSAYLFYFPSYFNSASNTAQRIHLFRHSRERQATSHPSILNLFIKLPAAEHAKQRTEVAQNLIIALCSSQNLLRRILQTLR